MTDDLLALAERVEKLTGPDREVDKEIWLATSEGVTRNRWSYTHAATGRVCEVDETREESGGLIIVPAFTSSIDAAVMLAPAGQILVRTGGAKPDFTGHTQPYAHIDCEGPLDSEAWAATMPLAMCAAALKARSKSSTEGTL